MGASVAKPITVPGNVHFDQVRATLPRMDGKVVAVTGCTSGIGLVCARVCGELGARIIMLNRASERADAALKTLRDAGINAEFVACDLTSFESVRAAAANLLSLLNDVGLDVLCNNAGVMGMPDQATGDGYDVQMQANHLSHFLLTAEIWPLLEKALTLRGEARVVNHSSGARKKPAKAMEARYLEKNGGALGGDWWPIAKWNRYQQSKLANLLFTYGLQSRSEKHGVAVNGETRHVKALCAHPGATLTNLQMKTAAAGGNGLLDTYILNSTMAQAHSEEDGSLGLILCCAAADVKGGSFYGPAAITGDAVLLPEERDPPAEELVWERSVASTGAKYFGEGATEAAVPSSS
eukprot:Opistho-2@42055